MARRWWSSGSGSILRRIEARIIGLDPRLERPLRLVRFYGIAAINTLFGYGVYAGFIALGVNLFVAQILSQVIGVCFNYFSYSRGVFRRPPGSKAAYIGAYVVNYLAGLTFLAGFHAMGLSDYLAGLATLLCASLLNFLVLSRFVFRAPKAQWTA
ncbi:GtrA family protein [uncultured Sphingomonas sp.]|uniref:GtrA family protein n=1 Tax=uncultured Sphingomonas sp. TaxID=158754 RepID=UPI0035C9D7AD